MRRKDEQLESVQRRALLRGAAATGLLAILAGCENMSPTSPDQEFSFEPKPLSIPGAAQYTQQKIFFYRMGGSFLGSLNYVHSKEGDEPEYSPALLKEKGIKLDDKVDNFYSIREEPLEGKAGKVIAKPARLDREHFLKVPSKRSQERQWLCYVMSEPVKEDEAYSAGFRKQTEAK